ncbi:response regulator of citrate/malate metabolism [Desulfosporosinus orientis DSM 765]|uniref:Transcriptional regulatory protein n=1 Tax=Desulfosporosinus orientis (strain ATCC 19365 / DSM 765 / NCIMB 8382 / VKM B-1628 / Singapore I) TaxID=768706 RepID=G7WEZ4_DESOD|nr:response regulator [Desulfosporosinus orientis]AET67323.1 response regulator of citrate/malate metabolism [Desulfosporosinus orientis DSM 765]
MNPIDLVLVEDDPMVMEVNAGFIKKIGGFKICGIAKTGKKALEIIRELRPRLVILDIYLPDLSGIQILQEIRKLGIPTDIILITAAQDVETVQAGLRFGVVDYIIKPFKFERISSALNHYLTYAEQFKNRGELNQEDLDRLVKILPVTENQKSREREELPKGLREITLQQVYNFLKASKIGLSAEEVAIGAGLARVTARRYLEYLEKINRVTLETQYGSVGRPINKYKALL